MPRMKAIDVMCEAFSPSANGNWPSIQSARLTVAPCVPRTPFGFPVEPEV